MLTKLRTLVSLYRTLGFRWSAFRAAYAFRRRAGLLGLQMPRFAWTDRPLGTWLKADIPSEPEAYALWRKQNSPAFFFDLHPHRAERSGGRVERAIFSLVSRPSGDEAQIWNKQTVIDEANRILSGELKYFSHAFHKTGFPPNWHEDPVTGIELSADRHWSQISDDAGVDIKFIWEANRFGFVYTLVRAYAASRDERYPEAFWTLVLDWAEHNPPNTGSNWMDGQEIALRIMAWCFGLYGFVDSPASTPQRLAQLTAFIAAQAQRICRNTDFALFTRGNHIISEALGLWLTGLLFPELKDAEKYLSTGRKLLEQEAAAQIFPDGSYSMYSLNYHRFILHVYLYAIRLGEIHHSPFSTQLQNSIANSIAYLFQLVDPETGQMPLYGSNDGALVLPLNNCDFNDYRPLLQLGWYLTKGELLFESGAWDEDVFWLCSAYPLSSRSTPEGSRERVGVRGTAQSSFPQGGVYLLRGADSKAVIRCTDFRARPSHADQLHVDLWIRGQNIACDAGTYLYSGEGMWHNGLARTSAHNTVIVDGKDQMRMISRFTWTDWAKGRVLRHDEKLWQGEHDGYTRLPDPVTHRRTVMALNGDRWLIVDRLTARQPHHYALHWLLSGFGVQEPAPVNDERGAFILPLGIMNLQMQIGMVEGQSSLSIVRGDPNSTRGWRSRYYGHKEPAVSVMLEADQSQAVFWTFFGFEGDVPQSFAEWESAFAG